MSEQTTMPNALRAYIEAEIRRWTQIREQLLMQANAAAGQLAAFEALRDWQPPAPPPVVPTEAQETGEKPA